MAETGGQGKPVRNRRNITRKNREDIYCYELPENEAEHANSHENYDELKSEEEPPADDDSFSYTGPRAKKVQQSKKKNGKQRPPRAGGAVSKGSKNKQDDAPTPKQKKQSNSALKGNALEYYHTGSSKVKDIKIFNPILYEENIASKLRCEKELEDIYQQYGRKIGRSEEPSNPPNSWNFLLRQVQEVGKDFASEREERIKLKRKLSKFSQSFFNRRQQIKEQKVKDEERQLKRQSLELMRLVKRKFWGSCIKVSRIVKQQQKKKLDKEEKMKKLEDLVARQFEASQRITKVLEGYQEISLENIEVSQTTKVPVILNIDRKPKYKYAGLHEDNTIRPSLLIKFPLREYQLLGVYWIYTLHNRGLNAILADEMGLGKTIQTIALLAHLAMEKGVWGPHLVIVPTTILMNWQIEFKRWCPAFKIMTYFGSPKERKAKRKGWSKLNSFHVCITSYKIAVTDHPIFRRKKWYYMVLDEAQNIKNFKSQRWQILLNFKTKHRLLLTGTPLQNDLTELWSLLHFLMPKIFNSFDDFNQWFNLPFQEALQKNFPISQEILKKLHTVLRPFFLRRLKKDVETQLPKKTESIVRCGMSRRQKYLYDEMIWHENKRFKSNQSAGMMNVLMGLKKICNHPDLFQPRIEETPLSWSPLTLVIAHHMFLKSHFETYKTHILRDFVDNFSATFVHVANDILSEYAKLDINSDNQLYYKHKYIDRLNFARVNFERSKRKPFQPYAFDMDKLEVIKSNVPFFMQKNLTQLVEEFEPIFDRYLFVVPKVMVAPASLATFPMNSEVQAETNRLDYLRSWARKIIPMDLERIRARFLLHFPNKSIILYDSGKLIKMIFLLKSIKYRGQKALVFTQMTKMLDIFEKVLNMFKFNYVRLDGSTKTQLRQTIVQRFNNDPRILCFISSTRSGGIGLNLTGASNVIFYDTDWNPAMDKQAQDRCHRIGQTRDVTIYRLITEYSIEENILMKSIHKRKLESLVTEQGMFDTSYFEKVSLRGLLSGAIDYGEELDQEGDLADVEDKEDRDLLQVAEKEGKQNQAKDDEQEQLQVEMLPNLFRYGLKMLDKGEDIYEGGGSSDEAEEVEEEVDEEEQEDEAEVSDMEGEEEDKNELSKKDKKQEKQAHEQKRRGSLRSSKIPKKSQGEDIKSVSNIDKQQEIFQEEEQNRGNSKSEQNNSKVLENPEMDEEIHEDEDQEEQVMLETNPNHPEYRMSTLDKLKAMAIYQRQYLFMKKHVYSTEEQQAQQEALDHEQAAQEAPKNSRSRGGRSTSTKARKRRR